MKGREKVQVQIAEKPFQDDHKAMWPYFARVTMPGEAPKWVETQAKIKSLLWLQYRFKLSYFCKQKLISGYQHKLVWLLECWMDQVPYPWQQAHCGLVGMWLRIGSKPQWRTTIASQVLLKTGTRGIIIWHGWRCTQLPLEWPQNSMSKFVKYTLTSVISPFIMSLPLLYPKTLGNGCAQFNLPPCCYTSLPYIIGFDIKIIHQRIQITHSHASCYHHSHYCNVDFVLIHNVTCYANWLLSHIHVNLRYLLNITCTLIATCMILGRSECKTCDPFYILNEA